MSQAKISSTSAERVRRMRKRNREDPDRKRRALDIIHMFQSVEVSVIVSNDGNIWFKGVDLARALDLEDPNYAIYCIDKKYTKTYEKLSEDNETYRGIPNMQPRTTFVNETGMNLFILRSRKPKAEAFSEWVCGVVLPSIRRTNKYEIEPADNPYRELNNYLKQQNEELKLKVNSVETELQTKDTELRTKETELRSKDTELRNKDTELRTKDTELRNKDQELINQSKELMKCVGQLFEMKASCVPKLNNEAKQEYLILYKKYNTVRPTLYGMPYYAVRIQLDSLEQRQKELLTRFPSLEKLLQLSVPNSVNFFNFILEQMADYLERGTGEHKQSFRRKNISEEQMITMIENLYRTQHGAPHKKIGRFLNRIIDP